jgi:transcriptional regulator with XRE-family HTH domain
MQLPEILKEYRSRQALRQKQVADQLGISRVHYAMLEEGRRLPSPALLEKMRCVIRFEVCYNLPLRKKTTDLI